MKRLNKEYEKLDEINKEIGLLWHAWHDKKINSNSYDLQNGTLFETKRRIIADIDLLFDEINDRDRSMFISRL